MSDILMVSLDYRAHTNNDVYLAELKNAIKVRFLEFSRKTKYFLSKLIILTEENWISKWESFKRPSCLCLELKAFKYDEVLNLFLD